MINPSMKVVTVNSMRELERRAAGYGLSSAVLMQLAGLAVADEMAKALDGVRGRRVLVLVGAGNNGGDGLVSACHLHDWGAEVVLYLWGRQSEGDGNLALCELRGIRAIEAASDLDLAKLKACLAAADMVLDALLGIGITRPITGVLAGILEAVESARNRRSPSPDWPDSLRRPWLVSLDVPTGLNADTGEVDQYCVAADLTVTLGFPKLGLFLYPGAARVGRLVTRDIGIPPALARDVPIDLLSNGQVKSLLPPRPADGNKGTFGKVMVVGGSLNYVGAPSLASLAALRAGAGLVTLAAGQSLHAIMASKLTEVTFLPLPEAETGVLGPSAVQPVLEALVGYSVLAIGCGLGRHPATVGFVRQLLAACPTGVKIVVDADGLNALAEIPHWWEQVGAELVLTPHPGEMARLLGQTIGEVVANRIEAVGRAAVAWGKTVVLKGAFTAIAGPDGSLAICPSANPALASAGTGDVLSGVIAGLLAQGAGMTEGAAAGVFIHAEAGEALRRELGSAGVLAGDLLGVIPKVLKAVRESN